MKRRQPWAFAWLACLLAPALIGCAETTTTAELDESASGASSGGEGDASNTTLSWPTEGMPGADAYRVQVPVEGAPSKGAAEPLVTLVVFSDFQCPFCGRSVETIDRLAEAFPDELQVVFRHNPLPFHADADSAARVAIEIFLSTGNKGFWRAHDQLFASQMNLDLPTLERVAAEAEIEASQVQAIVYSDVHSEILARDKAIARSAGARGTPTFFVNGRIVAGAQPYEVFLAIVDEERALAREAMHRGTPRSALYEAAMATARPPTPDEERSAKVEIGPTPRVNDERFNVPLEASDPSRGSATPLVTVVAYSDYECPFCSRIEPTLDALLERYGEDLRVIHRHNPLDYHAHAMAAAEAATEAFVQKGDEGFWAMHRLLFSNQRSLDATSIEKMAGEVGLNLTRFKRAVKRGTHKAAIAKQQADAQKFGATLTPSFFINGVRLRGAHPIEEFIRVIDEERAHAQRLIDGGVARTEVYAAAVRGARDQAPAADRSSRRPDAPVRYAIAVPEKAPERGPRDAKVVIQIYSDFECPFCNRARPTIERIVREYPKDVRFIWRNYPLPYHRMALPAANAAHEVFEQLGNDAFWQFHELLFDHQRSLNREALEFLAGDFDGLDKERFLRAIDGHAHRATIQADLQSIRDANLQIGTPTFFINGLLMQGAQPFAEFKRVIDAELGASGGANRH